MGDLINGKILLVIGIPIYLIISVISILKKYKLNMKVNWARELVKFIFALYVFLLLGVTLFPIRIGFENNSDYYKFQINLIPFRDVFQEISNIGTAYGGDISFHIKLILRNVGGNLILLLPLGVMSPILWKQLTTLKRAILQGFIVSLSIELLQLIEILSGIAFARIVDIDDLILNVLGVIIGYLIYRGMFYISTKYEIKFILNTFAESAKEQHITKNSDHKLAEI